MTRTHKDAPGDVGASRGGGVEMADHDTAKNHERGGRASARRLPSLPPIGATATRPRSIVLGQIAVSDDRMVKVSINPAGKASIVEVRIYSRSGGLFFPTADGLVLPVQAATFIGGHLHQIKKTLKQLTEAGL